MRMIFSLISLLIVVAIIGVLAQKQLSAVMPLPNQVPHLTPSSSNSATTPANIAEQSKQMQAQVKDQIGAAMEAASTARLNAETTESK